MIGGFVTLYPLKQRLIADKQGLVYEALNLPPAFGLRPISLK